MKSLPTVSVIISAYNRPDFLFTSLESVLEQTYPVQEIIVIDDCSPQPLEPVTEQFNDSRIRYIRLKSNRGANHARNTGVELAKGEIVAFLDDDDAWLPEKLAIQVARLSQPGVIGCLTAYQFMGSDRVKIFRGQTQVTHDALRMGNPYCGMSGLVAERKALLSEPFDETLKCGQDWDIFIRLLRLGEVAYVSRSLFLYRRGNHEGITSEAMNMALSEIDSRIGSTIKHRHWLGESHYKQRVAAQVLAYIKYKQGKFIWVKTSIEYAGLSATLRHLYKGTVKQLFLAK